MAPGTKTDWEKIEGQYRAGQLSVNEIAREHGITPGAIHNRAKRYAWSRDLTKQVRERVRAKLVTEDVTGHNVDTIIEEASEVGATVVRLQRQDIARMQIMEQRILAELGDINNPPTKVHISAFQGEVTQTVLHLTVTERAQALQALANVQHKRIQLERQAYNLDEGAHTDDPFAEFIKSIQANRVDLVRG